MYSVQLIKKNKIDCGVCEKRLLREGGKGKIFRGYQIGPSKHPVGHHLGTEKYYRAWNIGKSFFVLWGIEDPLQNRRNNRILKLYAFAWRFSSASSSSRDAN